MTTRYSEVDLRSCGAPPDSLGGDWTTAQNGAAVVWLTRAIMKRYAVDPGKVVLSGYSMGGVGTW